MQNKLAVKKLSQSAFLELSLNPLWILSILALSVAIVYVVGLEPMTYVHNSFHDLRHSTGFPCH